MIKKTMGLVREFINAIEFLTGENEDDRGDVIGG